MDFNAQKVNLSFSIENILRDDFAHHRRRRTMNFVSLPTDQITGKSGGLERWPPTSEVYQCCAVRYSPVYMKCLPNMQRVEGRLHKPNGAQFLREQAKAIEEGSLCCRKEEAVQNENGKHMIVNVFNYIISNINIFTNIDIFMQRHKILFRYKSVLSSFNNFCGEQKQK